jgi:putative ABC transport system permease protein
MHASLPFNIGPILSTLRRHKTASALIVLEIALSCAIICNAVFLIGRRLERIDMPSGLAEAEIVNVQLSGIARDDNAKALTQEDLATLRAIPGVASAAVANQVPFTNSSWNSSLGLEPDQAQPTLNATMYIGSEDLLETLGLRLVAGRDFQPDEYQDFDPVTGFSNITVRSAIITRKMAEKLFPGTSGVGGVFYFGDPNPIRVVGVVEHLVRPSLFGDDPQYSMLLPIRVPYTSGGHYLLRTSPGERERVIAAAVAALEKNSRNRIILEKRTFETIRDGFFRQDRSMVWLLVAVCLALLVVTALGIVGLASFWVQQRTKQIGIRRALGATRGQVLRYFQTENFLLASIGIAIGMMLAFGLNQLLMETYELPRLPAVYLPAGALALWLLGQLAVLGPARRAAAVPPAVATRSV